MFHHACPVWRWGRNPGCPACWVSAVSWRPSPALLGLLTTWSETCGSNLGTPISFAYCWPSQFIHLCVLGWTPFINRLTPCGSAAPDSVGEPLVCFCRMGGGLTPKELVKSLCVVAAPLLTPAHKAWTPGTWFSSPLSMGIWVVMCSQVGLSLRPLARSLCHLITPWPAGLIQCGSLD